MTDLQRCIATLHWLPGRGRRIDLGHADVAGAHLIERFRLFFLIALGETVITMGTAFTNEPFELERLLALAIAVTGTVALWWCYFQRSEAVGAEVAGTAEGAGAVGYWGTWTLTLIVLALIGIAVGDELAILAVVTSAAHDDRRDHRVERRSRSGRRLPTRWANAIEGARERAAPGRGRSLRAP